MLMKLYLDDRVANAFQVEPSSYALSSLSQCSSTIATRGRARPTCFVTEHVRGTILVLDAAAVEMVRSGSRELSAGYRCELEFVSGLAADGQPYHASQRSVRGNHFAIVNRARAGTACRIGMTE